MYTNKSAIDMDICNFYIHMKNKPVRTGKYILGFIIYRYRLNKFYKEADRLLKLANKEYYHG